MHKDHRKALQLRRERLTALVGGKDSTPIPPELTKLSNVEVEAVWRMHMDAMSSAGSDAQRNNALHSE